MKKIFIVLLVLIALFGIVACGNPAGGDPKGDEKLPVSSVFWGTYTRGDESWTINETTASFTSPTTNYSLTIYMKEDSNSIYNGNNDMHFANFKGFTLEGDSLEVSINGSGNGSGDNSFVRE
jgi:ABC-type glycerol-3-phosphate transport system substrate-binding protein